MSRPCPSPARPPARPGGPQPHARPGGPKAPSPPPPAPTPQPLLAGAATATSLPPPRHRTVVAVIDAAAAVAAAAAVLAACACTGTGRGRWVGRVGAGLGLCCSRPFRASLPSYHRTPFLITSTDVAGPHDDVNPYVFISTFLLLQYLWIYLQPSGL